jgi:ethanolamine utilization protein EutQ (cupin superfamily)
LGFLSFYSFALLLTYVPLSYQRIIKHIHIIGQEKEQVQEQVLEQMLEQVLEQVQEQEQQLNDSSNEKVDVEALISQNGNSPTLNLTMVGLTGPDMKIVADTLRNNKVRE